MRDLFIKSIIVLLFTSLFAGCSTFNFFSSQSEECLECILWERYAKFTVRVNNPEQEEKIHFNYIKRLKNLRIDVNRDRFYAFSVVDVPDAGLFYKNVSDTTGCSPNLYEQLHLQAKLVLYILAKAFPDGPQTIKGSEKFKIKSSRNYIQLSVSSDGLAERVQKWNPPWEARGTVTRNDDWSLSYEMSFKSKNTPNKLIEGQSFIGEWNGNTDVAVTDGSDKLNDWRTCYFGNYAYDKKTDTKVFVPKLERAEFFTTLAEVITAASIENRPGRHSKEINQLLNAEAAKEAAMDNITGTEPIVKTSAEMPINNPDDEKPMVDSLINKQVDDISMDKLEQIINGK
jgi:hypothetical protein